MTTPKPIRLGAAASKLLGRLCECEQRRGLGIDRDNRRATAALCRVDLAEYLDFGYPVKSTQLFATPAGRAWWARMAKPAKGI